MACWLVAAVACAAPAANRPGSTPEVYVKENGAWKLGSLSFTRLLQ
jgi:hypothetical protein